MKTTTLGKLIEKNNVAVRADDWDMDCEMDLIHASRKDGGSEIWLGKDGETMLVLSQSEPHLTCDENLWQVNHAEYFA